MNSTVPDRTQLGTARTDWERLAAVAEEAAAKAADHIANWSGRHRSVFDKPGSGSPASQVVTEVDHACERIILDHLHGASVLDDFGLLAEEREDDASRLHFDHFWCIDPLDGTLPFIENIPGYSVSIALVSKEGTARLGVVHDPRSGRRFRAVRGGGLFRDGESFGATPHRDREVLHWMMNRSMKTHARYREITRAVEELAREFGCSRVQISSTSGGVLHACRVLEEGPAIYFTLPRTGTGGGSIWDYAATACLFGEAGLAPCTATGAPLPLNDPETTFMSRHGVIYASSLELRGAVERLCTRFLVGS